MSRTQGHVDATFYAQVEPEWSQLVGADGERPVRGAKVQRVTKTRPERPMSGVVLVKLTIRVPAAAFYPLRPEAVVVIPADLTEPVPVEVEAEDPHVEDGPT